MEKLNSQTALRNAILQLEHKQLAQKKALNAQFLEAYDSLKPINLIKSTFKEITQSSELTDNLLNTVVGVSAGFISKRLYEGGSKSPIKRLIGSALMFGVSNYVAKNPETIKILGQRVLDAFKCSVYPKENGIAKHLPENVTRELR
jgi:hypothetical protein